MKAPEKIYLYPSNIPDQEYEAEWGCMPWDESSVEYTRTDAFIEKACDTIKNLLGGYVIRNFHFGDSYDVDELIDDFKKAMKGE